MYQSAVGESAVTTQRRSRFAASISVRPRLSGVGKSSLINSLIQGASRRHVATINDLDDSHKDDIGALYLAAVRLVDNGLIEESDNRPDPALDDRRRRYYRLTTFGREVASAEASRLVELARAAAESGLLIDPFTKAEDR